jgi:hypothetical protein
VFVAHKLNLYVLLGRKSVFKGLISVLASCVGYDYKLRPCLFCKRGTTDKHCLLFWHALFSVAITWSHSV